MVDIVSDSFHCWFGPSWDDHFNWLLVVRLGCGWIRSVLTVAHMKHWTAAQRRSLALPTPRPWLGQHRTTARGWCLVDCWELGKPEMGYKSIHIYDSGWLRWWKNFEACAKRSTPQQLMILCSKVICSSQALCSSSKRDADPGKHLPDRK